MNRVAIGYSTKDRTELTRRSIEPLQQPLKFDLYIADGSNTDEGKNLPFKYHYHHLAQDVCGGSGAAIVYLLSKMLEGQYSHVGLVEADVVLNDKWFKPTMTLFRLNNGLNVGAVSARCYEDRILCQRDGFAVMHNLGAGMVIFTREAAQIVLDGYRVQRTAENRAIFAQLAGVDIASYWAFRGSDHFLVADWRWDALLASRGLASVALTPSKVEMIGQNPPLPEQGLKLATGPLKEFDRPEVFNRYRDRLNAIRSGEMRMPDSRFYIEPGGFMTIFPHQIAFFGGSYEGVWRLKDMPGYGPFAWRAEKDASLTIPVFGPCEIFVSGGNHGGQVRVRDESGYDVSPTFAPEGPTMQVASVSVPGNAIYRPVTLTAMTEGCVFYGLRVREPQPINPNVKFNYLTLPSV